MHALPRIVESGPAAGYLLEALMAGVAQGDAAAKGTTSAISWRTRREGSAWLKCDCIGLPEWTTPPSSPCSSIA